MNATSTLRPAAADLLGTGRDRAPVSSIPSRSSVNGPSFSHLLRAGMKHGFSESVRITSEKHVADEAREAKSRKPEKKDDANSGSSSSTTRDANAQSKSRVSGQFGLKTSTSDSEAGDAAMLDGADPSESGEDFGLALTTTGANPDAGSILMALLMQSRTGGLDFPAEADASEADAEMSNDEDLLSPAEKGLAVPVVPTPDPWFASSEAAGSGSADQSLSLRSSSKLPAPAPDGAESKPTAHPGELAFALRLQAVADEAAPTSHPSTVPAHTSLPPSAPPIATAHSLSVSTSSSGGHEKQEGEHEGKDESKTPDLSLQQPTGKVPVHTEESASAPELRAPANAAEIYEQAEAFSNETVRNVHVQVVGEDNRRVDLRLMDRAGSLRVSVKSGDRDLNGRLQQQMPELTSRLEAARYQTEVWTPVSPAAGSDADEQQNQKPQRPAWVGELEHAALSETERTS